MTPLETLQLTRLVKAAFPAQFIDEYTPDAWHKVLGRYPFTDCEAAVYLVAEASTFCSAADIGAQVRKVRAGRLSGLNEIEPPADLDPDDPAAYLRWHRRTLTAVADGVLETPKALPPGQWPAQIRALLGQVGRRPPEDGQ